MGMKLYRQQQVTWWCVGMLLAMVLAVDCNCDESSYLWKVNTTPPLYLFGTVHLPYTTLWDHIPENAKTAFSSSEDLCVELRLSDPTTLSELSNCQYLPKGQTIDQVLSAELRQKISNYLARIKTLLPTWLGETSSGVSSFFGRRLSDQLFNAMVSGWEKKRPIWILLMLSSITEQNIRMRTIPMLDLFLDNAASGMGKRVQAMETPRDHCRPLNRLTAKQVELALRVQLDYLEPMAFDASGPSGTVERDAQTYRCGDFLRLVDTQLLLPIPPLDNITNVTVEELNILQSMDRYLMNQLVVRRNRKMVKKLDGLLQSERNLTYFIALGAGHLLGRNNVIDRLRKKGYTVQHIPVSESIEGPSLPSNIIALGHPGSVPRIMPVWEEETVDVLPTIDSDTLAHLWDKYIVNTPPRPSWPPLLTSPLPTSPPQGGNASLPTDSASQDPTSSEVATTAQRISQTLTSTQTPQTATSNRMSTPVDLRTVSPSATSRTEEASTVEPAAHAKVQNTRTVMPRRDIINQNLITGSPTTRSQFLTIDREPASSSALLQSSSTAVSIMVLLSWTISLLISRLTQML